MSGNRTTGNAFEAQFAKRLADDGCWVTRLAQTAAGQPADMIACCRSKAYLIDCKVCMKPYFPYSRIEPNQISAINFWTARVSNHYWFAILYDGQVYMLNGAEAVRRIRNGESGIAFTEVNYVLSYDKWKTML